MNSFMKLRTTQLRQKKEQSGSQDKPFTLPPGGVATVLGIPKFPSILLCQDVLIDRPEEGCFPEELLVMPVLEKSTAVHCRRITVTLRNVSNHHMTLKCQ